MRLPQIGLNRRLKVIKAARAHLRGSSASGLETSSELTGDRIAGVLALLLVVLIGGLFGAGAGRLADNTLAAASTSCPDGREAASATYSNGGTEL